MIAANTGERNQNCRKCKRRFNKESHFTHTHTHTLVLKIIIQICGKFSIIMNGFNRHSITHIGVRNYEYENFGMKFTDKDNLNRHILVHEIMNVNFMEKYLSRRVTLTHSN